MSVGPAYVLHVSSVVLQADGKILIGGGFAYVDGQRRNGIARLNSDGTIDPSFDPNANDYVSAIVVQADGKVNYPQFGLNGNVPIPSARLSN